MEHNVALWQQEIYQEDGQQESGPVAQLFQATVTAFSALLQIIADDPGRYTDGLTFYNTLQDEFQKFYVWNEGFPSSSGELDVILSCSKNLRATVLDLMVHWAKAVCRIPRVLAGYSWLRAQNKFDELEVLVEKIGQIADATAKDVNAQYATRNMIDKADFDVDSDADSDSSSFMSMDNFEDIIEDMKVYSESLMDLTPSLDTPASDFVAVEQNNITLEGDLLSVAEPARPFVLIIKDRFPSIDAALVKKLGEANWRRRARLNRKVANSQRLSTLSSSDNDTISADGTIVDLKQRQAIGNRAPRASMIRSSMSFASNYQSTTTTSEFSEPSIFDRHSNHISMNQQRRSVTESITSFATSTGGGDDTGRRRLPRLTSNHDFNSYFQCKICGDILRGISNLADWKKHVYDDLEPYICLFTGCALGLKTFQSQREWMIHEFTFHRTEASWQCNLCANISQTEQQFRAHIGNNHKLSFISSHISEVISASKRLEMRDGSNEVCPFCLVAPAQTQKSFARHVGRHLQEISFAALPMTDTSPDSDSDENSSDNDDGNSSDEGHLSQQPRKSQETVNDYIPHGHLPSEDERDFMLLEEISPTPLYEREIGSITRDSMDPVSPKYQRIEDLKVENFFEARSGSAITALPSNDTPDILALDHESEILYDTKVQPPTIRGGTLTALVEQLTRHDRLHSTFNNAFLLNYRSFTTARELFEQLSRRFHIQIEGVIPKGTTLVDSRRIWRDKKQKPIRFRVVNVLNRWLDRFWMEDQSEATLDLITDMHNFAKETVRATDTPGLAALMVNLERRLHGQEFKPRQIVLTQTQSTPPPILPKSLKRIKFLNIDVIEFARQLTILDSKLYNEIKPIECLNKTWERKVKEGEAEPAPNVKAFILHSNQVTNWVVNMILAQQEVKQRVLAINHFVSIANKCRTLNNYSSLMSIISALGTVAIYRLKRTWDQVPARTLTVLEQMRRLMGNTKNFAEYRDSLRCDNPPCVPYFGVYLADLANIEDRIPSIIEKYALINFAKYSNTAAVIFDIQQYQNVLYPLQSVPELQEYIMSNLQAAGEMEDMYTRSLAVEPREREDEKLDRILKDSGFL